VCVCVCVFVCVCVCCFSASISTYPGYVETDVKARGMVAVSKATVGGGT
jgi:hypothetical protein